MNSRNTENHLLVFLCWQFSNLQVTKGWIFVSLSHFLSKKAVKTVHHYLTSFSLELSFTAGLSCEPLEIGVYNGNVETNLICW